MLPLITQKRADIALICRHLNIQRLDVFGSAVSGRFDSKTSDLDFLVTLTNRQPTGSYADRYLDLADALESLFQRPVDLITEPSIRNPYFRREVEATRQLIYEQSNAKASV